MVKESYDQYKLAVDLIDSPFKNVLDLGCWNKKLKGFLPSGVEYQGLDYEGAAYFKNDSDVINYDMDKGLPIFKDNSFDVVFLLRVLQGLDKPHFIFSEALRVAKKGVVVSMSNMYYWVYRLKYLIGRYPVKSLNFLPISPEFCDRQKWLINYVSAADFIKQNAKRKRIIIGHHIYNHRWLKPLNLMEKFLSKFWPNLFVNTVTFYIAK